MSLQSPEKQQTPGKGGGGFLAFWATLPGILTGIAGVLISVGGTAASFYVQTLPFLASWLLIWALPRIPSPPKNETSIFGNMLDGFRRRHGRHAETLGQMPAERCHMPLDLRAAQDGGFHPIDPGAIGGARDICGAGSRCSRQLVPRGCAGFQEGARAFGPSHAFRK